MDAEQVFHSGELELANPLEPVARAQNTLGKSLFAVAGLGMASALLSGLLASRRVLPEMDGATVVLSALGACLTAGVGLFLLLASRRDVKSLVVPPGAPQGFVPRDDLTDALEHRVLQAYKLPNDLLRRLQRWWGTSAVFALPEAHAVARSSLQMAALSLGGALLAVLVGVSIFSSGPAPFAAFFTLLAMLGAAAGFAWVAKFRFSLVKLLVTQQAPKCEPEERIATVSGGGDPFVLAADLDQRLMEIRNNRVRNRIVLDGWDGAAAHVSETGRFKAKFVVENQPLNVKGSIPPAASRLIERAPALTLVASLLLSVNVPFAGPANFLTFLSGIGLLSFGLGFLKDARRLTQKFRWESTALVVDAEGSTGKAEIVAGRAQSDSFESKNTVIRSDCKFRWYAGKVVSESSDLNGVRVVTAVLHDTDSHKILEITESAVEAFRSKGVRVREIEFQDPSPQNILRANVTAVQAKAQGLRAARDEPVSASLGSASPSVALAAKFCTQCGTGVTQGAALFCSACGAKLGS
ncbi:MAG TPA: zinc ribbon domain-containing protein [Candidatus Thermoplasmatota archaeon]|nr:zinc ribbon domain-containing protein [Candidatus Thermoplasmatota archaeon]